jgi:hypothetical protein
MKTVSTLSLAAITALFIGCGSDSSNDTTPANSSSSGTASSLATSSSSSLNTSSSSTPTDVTTGNGLVDMSKYDEVNLYFNLSDEKTEAIKSILDDATDYVQIVETPAYQSCLDLGFSVNEHYEEGTVYGYRDDNGTLYIGDSSKPEDLIVNTYKFYVHYSSDATSYTTCQEHDYTLSEVGYNGTNTFARLFDTTYFETLN